MKRITGVAAFGLDDTVAHSGRTCAEAGFFLADAVLPQNPLGTIRTGKEAEEERVHSGMAWPKEARINLGAPLRRVPVPCAWTLLVEAGDTTARWSSTTGGSFSLAAILAEHVRTLLQDTGNGNVGADEVVVAIPNHLDEYGQEAFLRELCHREQTPVRLLWRPVAVAMAWLDEVQDSLGGIEENDWLSVVFLGADAIECTDFTLQTRDHKGVRYIVPVRERPPEPPGPSGADWAVDAMESRLGLGTEDPGAFWQAFTTFPEVWQALAGRSWENSELPRAWSKGGGWEEWSPSLTLVQELTKVPMVGGGALWQLLDSSCSLQQTVRRGRGNTWGEYLKDETVRLVRRNQGGRLRGVVICGPLAPRVPSPWFDPFGMDTSTIPKPDSLWLAAECDDPVAAGACIYGERLAKKLPTYLDTLPQIATVAIEQCEYKWFDLVEATSCEGGTPYKNKLPGQFKLQSECDWVEVYLKRVVRELPTPEEIVPTLGLPETWLTIARDKVRSFESLDAARNHDGWDGHARLKEYALLFAEAYFECASKNNAPYRKGIMRFPSAPEEDTILDLKVEMRPASGLAQVEFIPRQKEFLRGRRVFFDYSRMEDAFELPPLKRGWPETVKMPITNSPTVLTGEDAIEDFLASSVYDSDYVRSLDDAKKVWASAVSEWRDGKLAWLKKIDQDGHAGSPEGQSIVDMLNEKVKEHFVQLKTRHIFPDKIEKIVIRGTWLWGNTPQHITKYLEEYLKQNFTSYTPKWLYFIESASRCFTKNTQFNVLFTSIYKRLTANGAWNKFPIQSARSIYRVLMYRGCAQSSLNEKQAHAFLKESIKLIDSELNQQNIKRKFFQAVLLFFVLLRYRGKNPKFLDPDDYRYAGIFEHIEDSLNKAKKCVITQHNNSSYRIANLLDSIMAYVHFEGTPGIIQILVQEAGGD